MTTYTIHHSNGRTDGPYLTHDAAIEAALTEWPGAEIGHSADLTDGGDRTLIWECEQDAENDDGANAVASIRPTR
jgi:hypothetical protein